MRAEVLKSSRPTRVFLGLFLPKENTTKVLIDLALRKNGRVGCGNSVRL